MFKKREEPCILIKNDLTSQAVYLKKKISFSGIALLTYFGGLGTGT